MIFTGQSMAVMVAPVIKSTREEVIVRLPNGENVSDRMNRGENWSLAVRGNTLSFESNDGTIIVNGANQIVQLNLTPEQKRNLIIGAVGELSTIVCLKDQNI